MKAPTMTQPDAARTINHLQLGSMYRATTTEGATTGEYLGLESPHGDPAILLRHQAGTMSIDLRDVHSIDPIAA